MLINGIFLWTLTKKGHNSAENDAQNSPHFFFFLSFPLFFQKLTSSHGLFMVCQLPLFMWLGSYQTVLTDFLKTPHWWSVFTVSQLKDLFYVFFSFITVKMLSQNIFYGDFSAFHSFITSKSPLKKLSTVKL